MKQVFYLFLAVFLCLSVRSQKANIDSLTDKLRTATDTTAINILNLLADAYKDNDSRKSFEYALKAQKQAHAKGFLIGEARAMILMSICHRNLGNLDSAFQLCYKSHDLYTKAGSKSGMADAYNNIGVLFHYRAELDSALEYYTKALNIYTSISEKKRIGICYGNMAIIFEAKGDDTKAVEYNLKSLKLREAAGDKWGIASCYNSLGGIYKKQKLYDKSLVYYEKALRIMEDLGNKKGTAGVLTNMARLYSVKKDYKKQIEFTRRCIKIQEERDDKNDLAQTLLHLSGALSNAGEFEEALSCEERARQIFTDLRDKKGQVYSFSTLGSINLQKKNYTAALDAYKKTLELTKEVGMREYESSTYSDLSLVYAGMGDFKNAYISTSKYIDLKDSLMSEDNNKIIAEMSAKYETEKKDREIEVLNKNKMLQKAEIEKQQAQRNVFIVGFVLVLLLVLFVFRGYQQKKKANEIITKQKEEVETQKKLVEQQRDLVNEKQKEIIDSIKYAKRIQQALITNDTYIDKKLKGLNKRLK